MSKTELLTLPIDPDPEQLQEMLWSILGILMGHDRTDATAIPELKAHLYDLEAKNSDPYQSLASVGRLAGAVAGWIDGLAEGDEEAIGGMLSSAILLGAVFGSGMVSVPVETSKLLQEMQSKARQKELSRQQRAREGQRRNMQKRMDAIKRTWMDLERSHPGDSTKERIARVALESGKSPSTVEQYLGARWNAANYKRRDERKV